jgi:hypothetical protein
MWYFQLYCISALSMVVVTGVSLYRDIVSYALNLQMIHHMVVVTYALAISVHTR